MLFDVSLVPGSPTPLASVAPSLLGDDFSAELAALVYVHRQYFPEYCNARNSYMTLSELSLLECAFSHILNQIIRVMI